MQPADIPQAVAPAYPFGALHDPIELYRGAVELRSDNATASGPGTVELAWLPTPRIRFELESQSGWPCDILDQTCAIELATIDARAPVLLTDIGPGETLGPYTTLIKGIVAEPLTLDTKAETAQVIFHLTNFPPLFGTVIEYPNGEQHASRTAFETDGWRVTLDARPDLRDIADSLKQGAYGITHVGRLERYNGEEFAREDAIKVLEALRQFLSFARGIWVDTLLPVGYTNTGERAWEHWYLHHVSRWLPPASWFDPRHPAILGEAFPGFFTRWTDTAWHETMRLAIYWYVESNIVAGGIEGAIVLEQVALELLAWSNLVANDGPLSPSGFGKLEASDTMRLLLRLMDIPLPIPRELTDISALAKAENWPDGPAVLTAIRNTIVHPKTRRGRLLMPTFPVGARQEAYELGLWYLELVLLRLFKHEGKYAKRLAARWCGQVEHVPWVASPPEGEPGRAGR